MRGDIASGVALRLYHAGFKVIMLEVEKPTVIRCTVAFAQAVFDGEMTVEGVTARLATQLCGSDETYRTRIHPCDGRSRLFIA